jgi:pimeloyl-ACP methyl ester carboxylesterase
MPTPRLIARRRVVAAALLFPWMRPAAASQTPAASPATAADGPDYDTPLGIGLEEVAYPHPVRFHTLTLDGREERMAFMDVAPAGRGSGRTVVLLHGKNFWGAYWQETITALAQAGFRVVVPDQIGFGRSSKPDHLAYSFDLLAANTRSLLSALKIERAAVVGHSMGGMLAIRLARTYPETFPQLVLANPIGLEDYRQTVPPRTTEELTAGELAQTVAQIRAYRRAYFVRWLPAYERFVEVPARVRLSGEYPRWARVSALTTQMIYQQPVVYDLPRITQPTLLVIGQKDRTAIGKDRVSKEVAATLGDYPKLGRAAVTAIPKATLVEINDCGHLPHVEAPDAFHAALLRFLGDAK